MLGGMSGVSMGAWCGNVCMVAGIGQDRGSVSIRSLRFLASGALKRELVRFYSLYQTRRALS